MKIAILHAKRQDFCVIILHFVVLVYICGFWFSLFSASSSPSSLSSPLSLQYNILVETMKQWPKLVYFFCGCEVRDGFASCFVQFPLHEHMKCFVVIYKAHISIFTFLTFDSFDDSFGLHYFLFHSCSIFFARTNIFAPKCNFPFKMLASQ